MFYWMRQFAIKNCHFDSSVFGFLLNSLYLHIIKKFGMKSVLYSFLKALTIEIMFAKVFTAKLFTVMVSI